MVFFIVKDPDEELDIHCLVTIARTIVHTALEDLHRLGVDRAKEVGGRQLGSIFKCRTWHCGP